ncbi:MAG: hypothetical protein ISS17_00700 [Bacteroidales bacterium]|nr:hypothetical protein [Bacteroidales bacterium]
MDQLHDLTPGIFERFQQKVSFFENLIDMESYPETVEMPGLIIKTNSQIGLSS